MLNINKMCASETPRVYKYGKKSKYRNPDKEAALKATIFRENFFDHYHIYRSKHCPEPTKSYSTVKNQEYIKALKKKASEVNKSILSYEDYQKVVIQRSGVLKTVPVLEQLLTGGEPMQIYSKFDPDKKQFLKATSKKKGVINTNLDVDYVRKKGEAGFFIQCLFGKNINTNNIVFNIENEGLDILVSATRAILSVEFPKVVWQGWVLVFDVEQNTSFLAEINESVVSAAKQAYEKRIITLDSCIEQKNYLHFAGLDGNNTGVVQLPISKRTIDLRERNLYW